MGNEKFYVYVHRRLVTGVPFYVGKGHRGRAHSHHSRNLYWKNIVAKDGGRDVEIIVKDIDEEFAFLVEVEAIDSHKRRGIHLANISIGGEGPTGYAHSDESKRKMSESHKGVPLSESHRINAALAGIGRKTSQQTKDKLSAINKGTKPTAFAIARGIEFNTGRVSPKRGRPGKRHSEETKLKMSLAHTGIKKSPEHCAALSRAKMGHVVTLETTAKIAATKARNKLAVKTIF